MKILKRWRLKGELLLLKATIDRRVGKAYNVRASLCNLKGQLLGLCYRRKYKLDHNALSARLDAIDMEVMDIILNDDEKIYLANRELLNYSFIAMVIKRRDKHNKHSKRDIEEGLLVFRWAYIKQHLTWEDVKGDYYA